MPLIHSVRCLTPEHYYDQDAIIGALRRRWAPAFFNFERIEAMLRNALVGGRYLAAPLEDYERLTGLQARNDVWLRVATELATRAVGELLAAAAWPAAQVALFASSTVTGIAVPSLESRVMNRLPFAPTTKRLPIFGLGCLAGAAGVHRVADYLRGDPEAAAVFVTVELCSLTWQEGDVSVANIVSSGLFGDGCAAVLVLGDRHPLAAEAPLRLVDWGSWLFPDSEAVMGFDVTDGGFKVVLSPEVPAFASAQLAPVLTRFLRANACERAHLAFHIAHPGGPRVLDALEGCLGLAAGGLRLSRDSLARYGNMSSASVLFVLDELLRGAAGAASGDLGLMMAMGPGFCAEMSLLARQ